MTWVSLTQLWRVGRVWLIATVLKTVYGLNHTGVQIPHSPPYVDVDSSSKKELTIQYPLQSSLVGGKSHSINRVRCRFDSCRQHYIHNGININSNSTMDKGWRESRADELLLRTIQCATVSPEVALLVIVG